MLKRFVTFAAFAAMLLSVGALAAPPAEWGFLKLPEAMAAAKSANKPVFVLFGFETCRGCALLYRQALSDTGLRTTFQKNFILGYVDTEKHGEPDSYQIGDGAAQSHAELMSAFRGSPTPSWVFLTPGGVRLHGERGGKTAAWELLRDGDIAMEKFRAAASGG